MPKRYGLGFQKYVIPQVHTSSLTAVNSVNSTLGRVDFLISHPDIDSVIVEIDGQQHDSHVKADAARDSQLTQNGFQVIRIPVKEIRDGEGTALSKLFAHIDKIGIDKFQNKTVQPLGFKVFHGIKIAHQIQLVLVQALRNGVLNIYDPSNWNIITDINQIGYFTDPECKKLLSATVSDFTELLFNVSKLYSVNVSNRAANLNLIGSKTPRSTKNQVFVSFTNANIEGANTFYVQNICCHCDIAGSLAPTVVGQCNVALLTVDHIEYFLNYLFRKEKLWDGQYEGILRVLSGKDALLLLPTGGGKSLVYQLSSLLLPGKTIVVDPIIALMEDQVDNLSSYGIDRCVTITSQIENPLDRSYIMQLFAQGEYLFTFIAPERFQSKEFRDTLRTLTVHSPISMIVIDEAHCVSEWGHDFRTAYLNLGRISREYCESDGFVPPLVGLTGTASRSVLKDVQRELQITDFDAIITPPTFDRPELSFGVIQSRSDEKRARLKGYLKQKLPRLLQVSSSSLFQLNGDDTFSGLVFFPHVGGSFGAVENAEEIARELGVPVEFYSGSAPKRWNKGSYSEHKRRVATDYKRNRVPLLFSTNAYGMGIDKQNIRYTIHFGIPRSIESFYQEAGRAGRNRKKAHCHILVSNDYPTRTRELLDSSTSVEKVSRIVSETAWDENDDITRMLFFHTNSFRGIDQEKQTIIQVMKQLEDWSTEGETSICTDDIIIRGSGNRAETGEYKRDQRKPITEKALHRILILGIISDYTIDYSKNEFTVRKTGASKQDIVDAYGTYVAGYNVQRSNVEINKALGFLELPYVDFAEEMVDLVLHFIYEVIEKGRRRALSEMLLTAEASSDDEIRKRILRYLEETQFSKGLENIVTSARYDNSQVIEIADGLSSPREAEELRGQTSRYLESYPDHPALLILRAVAECLSRDRDSTVAKQDFLAAISSAFAKYDVQEEAMYELVSWALIKITRADTEMANEMVREVIIANPKVSLARMLIHQLPISLSSIPAWFLIDQINNELQMSMK